MKPQLIQTPWASAELITKIRITNVEPRVILPVLQVVIPKLRRGDILSITGYCHVTNDTHKLYGQPGYNLMIVGYLCMQIPVTVDGVTTFKELELSEKGGCNVNPERHHEPVKCFADYESKYDLENVMLQMKIYSASTAAKPNQYLTVDQDYGRLSCLQWSDVP